MSYILADAAEILEDAFQATNRGDRKIEMIKILREKFNLGLKHAKDLAEDYISFRWTYSVYNYLTANEKNILRNHIEVASGYNVRIQESSPTIGDILQDALNNKKVFLVVATKVGETEVTNSVNTRDEATALVAWANKLGWSARIFQEV